MAVSCHKPHAAKQNTKEKTALSTVIEHFIHKFVVQRDVDWSPAGAQRLAGGPSGCAGDWGIVSQVVRCFDEPQHR